MIRALAITAMTLLTGLALTDASASERIRLVHYNIRELDSAKLARGIADPQVRAVKEVMSRYPFDILSVNEMQYDLPGVPSSFFPTQGANIMRLLEIIDAFGAYSYSTSFDPANTGAAALRNANGEFELNPNSAAARPLVDPFNFGSFPAQYSTGAAVRFPIVEKKVYSRLLWKTFRPDRNLAVFRDGADRPLNETTAELFDKNFSDITLNVGGKQVHLLLFHAVPSHDFGNPLSMNSARNHDQLAFLEWYVTGKTSFAVPAELREPSTNGEIKPLPPGASFIAVGDWNVDVTDPVKPGADVLKRLYEAFTPWIREVGLQTFQGSSFDPAAFQAQLDYVFVSRDIRVLAGGLHAPLANARELGCDLQNPPVVQGPERVVRSYIKLQDGVQKTCWMEMARDFAVAKDASDHRLVWAEFLVN